MGSLLLHKNRVSLLQRKRKMRFIIFHIIFKSTTCHQHVIIFCQDHTQRHTSTHTHSVSLSFHCHCLFEQTQLTTIELLLPEGMNMTDWWAGGAPPLHLPDQPLVFDKTLWLWASVTNKARCRHHWDLTQRRKHPPQDCLAPMNLSTPLTEFWDGWLHASWVNVATPTSTLRLMFSFLVITVCGSVVRRLDRFWIFMFNRLWACFSQKYF